MVLGQSTALHAQLAQAPDSATFKRAAAGVYLVHWVKQDNSSEQSLYFKNTAQFPLQVTDWEIYDCNNIGKKDCGARAVGPLLKPGETARLITVRQRDGRSAYSYQYRFHVAWGPGVTSDSASPPSQ
jgi:hypothetical protein